MIHLANFFAAPITAPFLGTMLAFHVAVSVRPFCISLQCPSSSYVQSYSVGILASVFLCAILICCVISAIPGANALLVGLSVGAICFSLFLSVGSGPFARTRTLSFHVCRILGASLLGNGRFIGCAIGAIIFALSFAVGIAPLGVAFSFALLAVRAKTIPAFLPARKIFGCCGLHLPARAALFCGNGFWGMIRVHQKLPFWCLIRGRVDARCPVFSLGVTPVIIANLGVNV